MSWLEEMKRDAVALVDPDLVLTKDLEVTISMDYDDGWDPTYDEMNPSFGIEITVYDPAAKRYLVACNYVNQEASNFWLDLMKAASK